MLSGNRNELFSYDLRAHAITWFSNFYGRGQASSTVLARERLALMIYRPHCDWALVSVRVGHYSVL
jgi:hypothetical protein